MVHCCLGLLPNEDGVQRVDWWDGVIRYFGMEKKTEVIIARDGVGIRMVIGECYLDLDMNSVDALLSSRQTMSNNYKGIFISVVR